MNRKPGTSFTEDYIVKRVSAKPLTFALFLASVATPLASAYGEDGDLGGNRYYKERYYAAEISAANAYLDAVLANDWWWRHRSNKLEILDVRTTSEYKAGHPEGAYHMPYPRIYRACVDDLRTEDGECQNGKLYDVSQDPADLFAMVEELFPNKDQPLATLCRTGSRSIDTANILSRPETFLGPDYAGRGYTRVYNIWQGFVGQPMAGVVSKSGALVTVGDPDSVTTFELSGETVAGLAAYALDLDNDGDIDAQDKDGWRYHQRLPYRTKLKKKLVNQAADDAGYYDLL